MVIGVMVSDDLDLSRSALAALLERREEIRVVSTTKSHLEALEFAESCRPDVAKN